MESVVINGPMFPENETGKPRKLDYLGYAPCPLRNELRERLHSLLQIQAPEAAWYMPEGCHSPNVYDKLGETQAQEELPFLISETGFGDFNSPDFIQRWLDTGVYAPFQAPALRKEFIEAGLEDPQGKHRVIGANVELVLADMDKLGDRPLPTSWEDLFHPRFKGDIIVSGEAGDIHESILYSLYRDHGLSGLEALGRNVRDFMHPAKMVKQAGSGAPQGAALYILPAFFAKSSPHKTKARIVWPKEGAYLTPQYLLRQAGSNPCADLIQDFLCGAEWATHLHRIGFAPALAGSPALAGPLRWVGWDFVRAHNLQTLAQTLNAAFVKGHSS